MRRILLFVLKGNYNTLAKEDFMPAIGALRVMMHQMKNHLTMCSKQRKSYLICSFITLMELLQFQKR